MKRAALIAAIAAHWVLPSLAPALEVQGTPVVTAPTKIDPQSGGLGDVGFIASSTASNGTATVVAWTKTSNDPLTNAESCRLMLTRLNADGSPKDVVELARQPRQARCTVTAAGSGFLVACRDDSGLRGRYLNANGEPLGGSIQLGSDPLITLRLAAASNASKHAIIWAAQDGDDGRLMCTLAGPVENPAVQTFEVAPLEPVGFNYDTLYFADVVSNGANFFVAFNGGDDHIVRQVIHQSGSTPGPVEDVGLLNPYDRRVFVGAWNDGCVIAWPDAVIDVSSLLFALKAQRITSGGAAFGPVIDLFPQEANYGSRLDFVRDSDGSMLITRVTYIASHVEWTSRRMDASGVLGSISAPVSMQHQVTDFSIRRDALGSMTASIDADTLAGWGGGTLQQPLNAAGLPSGPVKVVQINSDDYIQQAPAVAWDGSRYLCVWQDDKNGLLNASDIRLRALGVNGAPLGPSTVLVETIEDQISPAIASSNGRSLVVWTEYLRESPTQQFSRLRGQLLENGAAMGGIIDISVNGFYDRGVSVAARPDGFFVSWRAARETQNFMNTNVSGTWVSRDGVVSHPGGFAITSIALTDEGGIASAGNDANYLVAWRREPAPGGKDLYGVILPAVPPVGPPSAAPFVICNAVDEQEAPRIVPITGAFRVLWRDARYPNRINALFTAEVSNAGVVSPANGQQVAIAPPRINEPGLVARAGGGFCALWLAEQIIPPYFLEEHSLSGVRLNASGAPEGSFALPPFPLDKDVFECAAGANGGILVAMEGKTASGLRSAAVALVFPDDLPASLQVSPEPGPGNKLLLRWQATRLFPADAALLEASADLLTWSPVTGGVVDQSTLTEGFLLVTPPAGARLYYRIHADLNP